MAAEMKDVEYNKGETIAQKGQVVVPALYMVRSGKVVSTVASMKHFVFVLYIYSPSPSCHLLRRSRIAPKSRI